jgi:RNA 2',3'-cyclic 3'-phosphodiesterase
MNYFFALTLSEEVRAAVAIEAARWQKQLGDTIRAKWYEPHDYHITLKFLGSISEEQAESAAEAVAPLAETILSTIPINLTGAGVFPGLQKPHVLWIGVSRNKALTDLAAQIDVTTETLGFARETRTYQPHITIARWNGRLQQPLLLPKERAFSSSEAHDFVLMQTLPVAMRPKNEKTRYNIVRTFPFAIKSEIHL